MVGGPATMAPPSGMNRRARKALLAQQTTAPRATATLFVRNLAFDTTDAELERIFGSVAPVKKCFTVKERGSEQCRGFGYVIFALHEDAVMALEKLNNSSLNGRSLRVELATPRAPEEERRKRQPEAPKPDPVEDQAATAATSTDYDATTMDLNEDLEEEEGEHEEEGDYDGEEQDADREADSEADMAHVAKPSKAKAAKRATAGKTSISAQGAVQLEDDEGAAEETAPPVKSASQKKKERRERQLQALVSTETEPERRTLYITGISDRTKKSHLFQKCRKSGMIDSIEFPLPDHEGRCAYVCFKTIKDAIASIPKLNLHELHGSTLAVSLKRHESEVIKEKVLARAKDARLIIRNLAFTVDEDDLRHNFGRFGKMVDVKVVRDGDKRSRGFGFVQFGNVSVAGKAIKSMNGREIKERPIAVDWALAKDHYERMKTEAAAEQPAEDEEEEPAEGTAADDAEVSDAEGSGSEDTDENEEEEEEEEEAATGMDQEEDNADSNDSEDDSDDSDDSEAEARATASKRSASARTPVAESGSAGGKVQREGAAAAASTVERKPRPPRESDTVQGRTLFVRNLSFETEEEDVEELFEEFGELEYALIVRDRESGRSRGTGFIKFTTKEAADACLARASNEALGELELDGRPLSITIALDRGTLEERTKERSAALGQTKDKRNLYLSREGQIVSNTPAYEALSEHDRRRRDALELESRNKMKNPNMFVSQTRLSMHNLPRSCDEKALRATLTTNVPKLGPIKQVKIVKSTDRVDSNGQPRSKGFGFVEFAKHEDALETLRAVNNNPSCFGTEKRPIVMFAWENAQAVKRREDKHRQIKHRQDQLKKAKQANVKGTAAATTDKPEGKKSKSNRKAESTDETPSAKKSKVKKSKPDSAEGTSKPKTMPAKAAAEDCVSGADKTAAAAPESDAHVRSKRKERKYKKAQARAAVEREGGAAAVTEGAPPAKRVRSGSDSAAAAATAPTVSQTSKAVEKRSAAKPDGKREHKTAKRPATADTAATATAATTTTGVTAAARPSSAAVSKSKRGAGAEKRTGPTATRPASAPAHANGTAKRTGPAGRSVAHTSDKRQGRSSASSAAPNGTATARHEAHALTALGDTGSSEKRAPRRVRQAKEAAKEQSFDDMVSKYRRKLEGSAQTDKTRRWFDE